MINQRPKLFASAHDGQNNAVVNYSPERWYMYATGYREAADQLVEQAITVHHHLDVLVYPIVFLYRQYLELRLKEIILQGNLLLDHHVSVPATHELDALWVSAQRVVKEVWPNADDREGLEGIDAVVQELAAVDPQSMAFRYPVDKKTRKPLIRPSITHINLRNFRDVLREVSSLLDGASTGITEYLSDKSEMRAHGL